MGITHSSLEFVSRNQFTRNENLTHLYHFKYCYVENGIKNPKIK